MAVMPAFPPLCTILGARWNDLITRFDTAGFRLINSGLVSPVMDWVMVAATVLGGGTHQAVFCAALVIAGIARRQVNWRRAGYAGLAAAAMSTATVQICKHIWDRPRPLLAMFGVRVLEKPLFVHSFPSGHTMTAFAVAFACSAFVPRLRWVLIPFACLTGVSRIYVGAHFPIDVMFGALVGTFLGLAGAAIVRRWSELKEAGRGLIMLMRRYGAYILLVAMCAGMFFWGLGRTPFIGFDEGVYSECSREMLASGDYAVPRVGGDYFFDKPPLCYWLQAGSMRVLGVNPLGARLPTAIVGLLMVGWTVFLGGRLFGGKAGLYAGFALASSILYAVPARMAIMDQAFSFTISLALGAFLLTYLRLIPRWGYVGCWAAMGAASLIKGPAGVVLALITAVAFLVIRRDWRGIPRAMPALGIVAFLAIALPWHLIVQSRTGGAFAAEFFLHQNLARAMGQDFHHNSSLFLYIPLFALGFFPWSIFFIKAWDVHVRIRADGDDRTGQAALFAGVWTVSIIAVFSFAKSKLPGYILPALPGAALLVGLMWSKMVEAGKAAVLRPYAIASLAVASVFAVLLMIGPRLLPEPIPGLPNALIPMGACMLLGTLAALILVYTGRAAEAFAALCAGMAGFLVCLVVLGLPIASRKLSDPVVRMAEIVRGAVPPDGTVLSYRLKPAQPALGFYAGRTIPARDNDKHPICTGKTIYIVAQDDHAGELPSEKKPVASALPYVLYKLEKS